MKKYFFSYADHNYPNSKKRIFQEAIASNFFDVVKVHGPEDLPSVSEEFRDVLNRPRGGGYWLWKILLLEEYFHALEEGDYLIYADAGCTINKNENGKKRFQEYLHALEKSEYGVLSFASTCAENHWSVKELYDYFGFSLHDPIINRGQYIATVLIFKKCSHSLMIIKEVMKLLRHDPAIITDQYHDNQHDFFIESRHDQSILSLARKKYGSLVMEDESDVIPTPFLRRVLIAYIGKVTKKNCSSSNSGKQIKKTSSLFRLSKHYAPYVRLILAKIFCRRYPFWATRMRG